MNYGGTYRLGTTYTNFCINFDSRSLFPSSIIAGVASQTEGRLAPLLSFFDRTDRQTDRQTRTDAIVVRRGRGVREVITPLRTFQITPSLTGALPPWPIFREALNVPPESAKLKFLQPPILT